MSISKPYAHGPGRWRCRWKTLDGWRWAPSAATPEEAVAAAATPPGVADLELGSEHASGFELGVGIVHSKHAKQLTAHTKRTAEESKKPDRNPGSIRLEGPYKHRDKVRFRVVSSAGRRWAPAGRNEKEAQQLAEKMRAKTARQGAITIRDAIDAYLESKRQAGLRTSTLQGNRNAAEGYCRGIMDLPVCRLTPQRAQDQYDKLRAYIDPRTGRLTSVATHRSYLSRAKSFARWLVARGWIPTNPAEGVQGVGRRRRGKAQLSLDEVRKLIATCLGRAIQKDEGAAATLMSIGMGLRASEILSRTPRDLDNGGTIPIVDDHPDLAFLTKNESSKRRPEIPAFLRPILSAMAAGKGPGDPLFPGRLSGRRRRQWLNVEVARLCSLAGVPVVCPHSMRGALASAATTSGVLPDLIAKVLGHSSPAMTLQHYIAPGVHEAAQRERGLGTLTASPPSPPT